jgi:5-methylcytosine-specific restriction protein A
MPVSAPRPCNQPGCGVLVRDGGSRCPRHPKEAWSKPVKATKRITGRRLQRMRASLFSRDPLCAECRKQGRVTLATQRDHIIPLAEGGLDDETNEQGLCDACHEGKSLAEALRGRGRSPREGAVKSLADAQRKPAAQSDFYGKWKLPPRG